MKYQVIALLLSNCSAQQIINEDYNKLIDGKMCKNYHQISIHSPSVQDCYELVLNRWETGLCGNGNGVFNYGQLNPNHMECACCLDDDATKNTWDHSQFTLYQVPYLENLQEPLEEERISISANYDVTGIAEDACGKDESLNVLGENKCTKHIECDGKRDCSSYGWCQGQSGCDKIITPIDFILELKEEAPLTQLEEEATPMIEKLMEEELKSRINEMLEDKEALKELEQQEAEEEAQSRLQELIRNQPSSNVIRKNLKKMFVMDMSQFSLAKSSMSCEGAEQGQNLGVFSSPQQCAVEALNQGCNFFMQSAVEQSWGCRCCKSYSGLQQHDNWDVYHVKMKPKHSCEGSEQGENLGEFKNAMQCAPVAAQNGCDIFMFSRHYPSWGCRCCNSWSGLQDHDLWDTFSSNGSQ